MIIDCHAHLVPKSWFHPNSPKSIFDIDGLFNEHAAELTAKYPKRLLGLACTMPFGNDAILKETEKAVRQYKLKGIMVGSSVSGEYLDSPRATPFFELVSDLNVPLFVHPPKFTIGNEKMEIFRLPEMLGRPFDTTLSLTRFIFTGGFEK